MAPLGISVISLYWYYKFEPASNSKPMFHPRPLLVGAIPGFRGMSYVGLSRKADVCGVYLTLYLKRRAFDDLFC